MKRVRPVLLLVLIWLALGVMIFFESAISLPWISFFCSLLLVCLVPQRVVLPLVIGISAWLSYWYIQPWWAIFLGVLLLVAVARSLRPSRFVYIGFMGCYVLGMAGWAVSVTHTASPVWLLQVSLLAVLLFFVWRTQLLTKDFQVWYIR